jgi:hypothetical protein
VSLSRIVAVRGASPPARRARAELLVVVAFAVTVGWSFHALRAAAHDAELLRGGYAPLLLRIGEALTDQYVFNAQLNHITAAKDPSDVREWIETARRTRPLTYSLVRKAADRGLGADTDPAVRRFHDDILREGSAIDTEPAGFTRLTQALAAGDADGAEQAQRDLAKHEAEAAQRLRSMRSRVADAMESLTGVSRRREERSIEVLVVLSLLTLLAVVGAALARPDGKGPAVSRSTDPVPHQRTERARELLPVEVLPVELLPVELMLLELQLKRTSRRRSLVIALFVVLALLGCAALFAIPAWARGQIPADAGAGLRGTP